MRLLILGGTLFLGRHLTEIALRQGHAVTLFNRGRTQPTLFPHLEQLRGDRRAGDLAALVGRDWDAVIDTCGYVPREVQQAATWLSDQVDHYTFISTLSVYSDESTPGQDETGAVGTLADESIETVNGETYGPLKVLCERAALTALPGRALIIRPGLIVGPHDPTDRFTYWPARVARGGSILAPGRPDQPVQFIDVRDLAEWIMHLVEHSITGIFNAAGPERPLPMKTFLEQCQTAAGSQVDWVWVDEAFLLQQAVGAFVEMPLWVPSAYQAFNTFRFERAMAAGLVHRPILETIRDTLAWQAGRAADHVWRAGLSPARETELLRAWRAREQA